MSLAPGTTLGPYRILAPLGAGGMGEVYRARDTRLGRDVAIKVLPPHRSDAPEVRARFEREARTISQLNHPHICTLHDVGHQDGVDYLVMELVEGETLAVRLRKGPLTTADVLRLGAQIADALDRAHQVGVVHRDLKPENVMLTQGGAKLMDFGLARTSAPIQLGGARTESPTESRPLTAEGTILGTLQFMAPEQLEGKEADARSDIWALGCVLYEMATGTAAFEGKSKASLIAAILEREPRAMAELQPLMPPALEHAVKRCLAKAPGERWQSARDVAHELEWILRAGSGAGMAAPAIARRQRRERLTWVVVAVVVAGGSLLGILVGQRIGSGRGGSTAGDRIARRFDLVLPDTLPMTFVGGAVLGLELRSLALSPRGDVLVYVAEHRGSTRLVSVDLTNGAIALLPGTEGATSPFFSPGGDWVGFLTDTELKKVAIHGASPITLAQVDEPWGAQWRDAERIVAAERQANVLTVVRPVGGRFDSLQVGAGISPSLTPDGSALLWSRGHVLFHLDLDSRKTTLLTVRGRVAPDSASPAEMVNGVAPLLLPSGHLLYLPAGSNGTLVGVPVAPGTLRPLGEPTPIATGVRLSSSDPGTSQYASSPGLLVYAADAGFGFRHFVRRGTNGAVQALAFPPAEYGNFALSPEGSRLAVTVWPPSGQTELWIYDLVRGDRERMGEGDEIVSWAPDGSALTYTTSRWTRGAASLTLRRRLDGSGRVDTLARSVFQALSPDGRWGLLSAREGGLLTRRDSSRAEGVFLPNILANLSNFSPDSRWLAGTYWEGGRSEVYLSSVEHPTGRIRLSTAGGEEPRWSPDGRRIVYRYRRDWYRVSLRPGTTPTAGPPERLFSGPYVNVPYYSHDVFPDGSHLVLEGAGDETTHRLRVVTNLESLLPSVERRGRRAR